MSMLLFIFLFESLFAMPNAADVPQDQQTQLQDQSQGQGAAQELQSQNPPDFVTESTQQNKPIPMATASENPPAQANQVAEQTVEKYDQLKWPDTIELSEGVGDIIKSDDPKIVELSKKASRISDSLKKLTNEIKETSDKVNQEHTRVNSLLDDFYQKIGFDEGKIQSMLK